MRAVLLLLVALCGSAAAQGRLTGETLYLSIYSHVLHGDPAPTRTYVSVSVSIRNTDPALPIRVRSAEYYDTSGKRIKEFLPTALVIPPMGTHELFIPPTDKSGGSGANFVIVWDSQSPANPPIVEGVHALLSGGRSVVFTTQGHPIAPR